MIGYWTQDSGLVSNQITNIEMIIKWIRIITNVVLTNGWGIYASCKIFRNESRGGLRSDIRNKNNISGTIPPSNHSFLR